jgi:hypothetical protein
MDKERQKGVFETIHPGKKGSVVDSAGSQQRQLLAADHPPRPYLQIGNSSFGEIFNSHQAKRMGLIYPTSI